MAAMSEATTALIRYDAMCRAIDAAYQVDEVKDIRDKAKAWEEYSRQAKNVEAERRACEIRLRAERKAGHLLQHMEKAKGGGDIRKPKEHRSDNASGAKLSDLGISKDQSSRWQKLAEVPEEEFEAALTSPEKPTTNGIISAVSPPKSKEPAPSDQALWLWGRLCDFERNGTLAADPAQLLSQMTPHMRAETVRLAPLVKLWLERIAP